MGFPRGSDGKGSACKACQGNLGSIPGLGRSPGGGNSNPLQCSCLENPTDRGAWWAAVRGVTKSRTQPSSGTKQQRQSAAQQGNFDSALWRPNWEGNQKRGGLCARLADSPCCTRRAGSREGGPRLRRSAQGALSHSPASPPAPGSRGVPEAPCAELGAAPGQKARDELGRLPARLCPPRPAGDRDPPWGLPAGCPEPPDCRSEIVRSLWWRSWEAACLSVQEMEET